MKKALKFFAMTFVVAALFSACGKDETSSSSDISNEHIVGKWVRGGDFYSFNADYTGKMKGKVEAPFTYRIVTPYHGSVVVTYTYDGGDYSWTDNFLVEGNKMYFIEDDKGPYIKQ